MDEVLDFALEQGFQRAGIVNPALLSSSAQRFTELAGEGFFNHDAFRDFDPGWITQRNKLLECGSILVCALSCFRKEPDDLSTPGNPHGLIAPFARRNYYRDAVKRMRRIVWELRKRTPGSGDGMRIFANSRIPEKPLAAAAGLGSYGKNSLIIVPGLGSLFVLACLYVPFTVAAGKPPRSSDSFDHLCGSCTACMDACPAGAIMRPGIVDAGLCFQALASRPVRLPAEVMALWGRRIYGCQTCQAVCPHNRGLAEESDTSLGELGPSLPLAALLGMGAAELRKLLRKSAMSLSWVALEAILRNTLIAAGNSGEQSLLTAVERFVQCNRPVPEAAARWARERIRSRNVCEA